jgi:hypothetical protein
MRLTSRLLLSLAVLCAALLLRGEVKAQSSSGAILAGSVVKEPGSEPVKKALIELIALISPGENGANYTAVTGTDGAFRIENILPGSYRLFVERTGFQEIDKHHHRVEGRLLTITAGQEIKDLVIRVQAAAVIQGRITDEDGDPMPQAQVSVFRETFIGGHSHWEQAGSERTNDLGEYRIANLPAGSYFASVAPPPDFRSLIETVGTASHTSTTGSDKPAPTAYQTTYYPDTRDRSQAAPIQLHPGDEFPANFSLASAPSLTIRGSVVNVPTGSGASIMLQSKDFNFVLNGADIHKDGSFEIRDVSPGAYTIIATVDHTPAMMARQSLQVADNVDGIRLAPQAGGSIRGRFRVEASPVLHGGPDQVYLLLRPADDGDDAMSALGLVPMPAEVHADGSFEWKDVAPGRYFVQLSEQRSVPDWFLKSVSAGGHDASESGFTVGGGPTSLDVVASANGASIEGVATNTKDEPVADAVVVAVPEARFRRLPDHFGKTLSDQSGHFRLQGLSSGSYTIFAWESVEGEAYYNSDFLKNYEGQGKDLHVAEGEHASLQVRVIPENDDSQ